MVPPKQSSHASAAQSDPRFASFATDPRYRLPRKKDTHVKLDKRFAHVLLDDADFSRKTKVDRYGRKVSKGEGEKKRKGLKRLYEIEDEEDGVDDDEEVRRELERVERDDLAEGGREEAKGVEAKYVGYSGSSSSEEEDESSSEEEESEEEDLAVEAGLEGFSGETQDDVPMGEVSSRLAVVNLDWDHIRALDIMAVAQSFCPRDGAIQSVAVYPSEYGLDRMEKEEFEGPDRELFAKAADRGAQMGTDQPIISTNSKARRRGEESDSSSEDFSEDDESAGYVSDNDHFSADASDDEAIQERLLSHAKTGAAEVDTKALRVYQLSRLRYYYAVIVCSSSATARALYDSMDSREYLSTANFFDLRFVPEDTTFPAVSSGPGAPRETCVRVPPGYKPAEFVTEALTHSKVRLTWEEEDRGRKEVQKRAFAQGTGVKGKKGEIEEDDLAAYVGSGSSDEEDEDAEHDGGVPLAPKTADDRSTQRKSKAAAARRKMRLALGLPVDDEDEDPSAGKPTKKSKSRDEPPQGNMQITFSSALSGPSTHSQTNGKDNASRTTTVFENTPESVIEETTRERYIRKERERKARRKETHRTGGQPGDGAAADALSADANGVGDEGSDADAGFDDPFFADPAAANAQAKKAAKKAKREQKTAEAAREEARLKREREELELLMADGDGAGTGGDFDMAAIRKAEKEKRRKGKGKGGKKKDGKRGGIDGGEGDAFEMDVEDPRFGRVFEDHEFAIDPSNPRFSGTEGMRKLLEEGRRKRKGALGDGIDEAVPKKAAKRKEGREEDVKGLVEKVKRRKV